MKINKTMTDAIVAGVVASISAQIMSAMTAGTDQPETTTSAADDTMADRLDVRATGEPRQRIDAKPRRVRKTTGRTSYRAVKPGKAGLAVVATLAERLQPAYSAIRAAGSTGLTMPGLEYTTGRTTKQLENDVMALRTLGHVISQ